MTWHSSLTLGFTQLANKTLLNTRQHTGALRVQRALYPETDTQAAQQQAGICHIILLYPPAGIAGGDILNITLNAYANTHAVLTTPGANKWYGMPRQNLAKNPSQPTGEQYLTAYLANHARLEWLPQESIFYHDSHATAINHIYLADSASFIGWEINVLGRQAYQEIYQQGTLSLQTYFWRDSLQENQPAKLIFADVLNQQLLIKNKLSPSSQTWFSSKTGLNHHPIFGTLWTVPTLEQKVHLKVWTEKLAIAIKNSQLPIVVTHTNEVLLVRYLGDNVRACFSAFSQIRGELRRLMWDLDNHEPRIWAT